MESCMEEKKSRGNQKLENSMARPRPKSSWAWVWVAGILVVSLWFLLGWILPGCYTNGQWESAGQLGDSFGMVNALFSGLAFLGVIVAIWLQNKEFQNQLHEFSEQTQLQRKQLDQEQASIETQRKITEEQFELLKEERKARIQERELAAKPILMLRVVTVEDSQGALTLYNGGAPIFDLRITGGNHRVEFLNESEERSTLAQRIDRENPAQLHIEKKGMSGPLGDGHFSIEYRRIDHEKEAINLRWSMPGGFQSDQTPHTEVWQEEE